eukprot:g1093.t1
MPITGGTDKNSSTNENNISINGTDTNRKGRKEIGSGCGDDIKSNIDHAVVLEVPTSRSGQRRYTANPVRPVTFVCLGHTAPSSTVDNEHISDLNEGYIHAPIAADHCTRVHDDANKESGEREPRTTCTNDTADHATEVRDELDDEGHERTYEEAQYNGANDNNCDVHAGNDDKSNTGDNDASDNALNKANDHASVDDNANEDDDVEREAEEHMNEAPEPAGTTNKVLRRTDKQSKCGYINERVATTDGMTMAEAVGKQVTNAKGKTVRYGKADAKYDTERGEQNLQPEPKTKTATNNNTTTTADTSAYNNHIRAIAVSAVRLLRSMENRAPIDNPQAGIAIVCGDEEDARLEHAMAAAVCADAMARRRSHLDQAPTNFDVMLVSKHWREWMDPMDADANTPSQYEAIKSTTNGSSAGTSDTGKRSTDESGISTNNTSTSSTSTSSTSTNGTNTSGTSTSGTDKSNTGESSTGTNGTSTSSIGKSSIGKSNTGESSTGTNGTSTSSIDKSSIGKSNTGESSTNANGTGTNGTDSFPGAYSGQGRSWELKTKEAIELLPDKYGFQPKAVLSARAPPTITATAVDVPMHERAQYGSAYIAVSDGAGQITPRKLAAPLNTPAVTHSSGWTGRPCGRSLQDNGTSSLRLLCAATPSRSVTRPMYC